MRVLLIGPNPNEKILPALGHEYQVVELPTE